MEVRQQDMPRSTTIEDIAIVDSCGRGPKPEFPQDKLDRPGSAGEMRPKSDHGDETYEGFGRLTDRVTVTTAGDSGIGRAVTIAFAPEGCDLAGEQNCLDLAGLPFDS